MGASLKPKPAAIGEIWMIPANSNDVPAGEPIHQHPDFQTKNAWHHPCLVIADPDDKEYLKCFQMTAFSGYPGGLEEKYPGPGNRNQRNRWLLVESSQRQGHDNLPVLKIEKGIFSKPSYVNTEKYFKIKAEHLVPTTKIKLTIGSVDIAKMHHYKYWHDDKMTAAIR
jgi:hypothetical protein